MSGRIDKRVAGMAALAAALCMASSAVPAASGNCDRSCLRQLLDSYLAAVFKHDPAAAPLTADHYATYDTAAVANGEGFWKNVTGYGAVQRSYVDPAKDSASFFGLLSQDGHDVIASVRIRVDGRRISEAEWLVALQGTGAQGLPFTEALPHYPPPTGVLAPAQRTSRLTMISLANNYFQAVKDHDGSWVPSTKDCIRVENGVGAPSITPGGGRNGGPPDAARPPRTIASVEPLKGACLSNFENFKHLTKELALRRFMVVDEEAGVVASSAIFVRYPSNRARHNLVHEYFIIRDGKIAGIWTSMYYLPPGTPISNGWEDREDP